MDVPGPRSPHQRRAGEPIPLTRLLPRPVHYVMAGGGSHGAVQWGALQALAQTDLVPDAIIGTSAGALTGSILAEDFASGVSRIAYVWGQLNMSYVAGTRWKTRSLTSVRSVSLMPNTTQEATLRSILHTSRIENLEVPFAAVATDLADGSPHVFDSGLLIPALLASSAIPGVLPPVEIDGRRYVDGLASANLPAIPALHRGAGSIVVLDTGSKAPGEIGTTPAKVLGRVGAIMAGSQRRRQLREAARNVPVLLLPTPADLGGSLDFAGTMRAGASGYAMTRAFLADLVLQRRRRLRPGLYARPDDHGLSHELRPMLREVTR
ncbi:MAG TPA: patatin-like phospholipase family protein [Actinomycetota bacterium]|nr:patatin-like phospholipase family protein [Actinomycetota bacterium]HNO15956.1 patatin-like phospholipase family protein [Actinomycetota bacterium]HUM86958.1 patatin-like phospholipase family protein [Actinomycetota bacterium]